MIIHGLMFYVFAVIAVASAIMVVYSKNPVHSVLFLILCFFNGAGLFLLMGAEFLAMMLIVVYVGAVAVLFMFVVMMLDINFAELRQGFTKYLPIGLIVGAILFAELLVTFGAWTASPGAAEAVVAPAPPIAEVTNTEALGNLIYTQYVYLFQAAGLILLIAMIGAIVLTHRRREGVRRQVISEQNARAVEESVEVVQVPRGGGV